LSHSLSYGHPHKSFRHTFMVTVWFGVGQFLSGAMGQLYPGGDIRLIFDQAFPDVVR